MLGKTAKHLSPWKCLHVSGDKSGGGWVKALIRSGCIQASPEYLSPHFPPLYYILLHCTPLYTTLYTLVCTSFALYVPHLPPLCSIVHHCITLYKIVLHCTMVYDGVCTLHCTSFATIVLLSHKLFAQSTALHAFSPRAIDNWKCSSVVDSCNY